MYFSKTIRGTETEIFTEDWDGDPSLGIPNKPTHVHAVDENGNDFPLEKDEIAEIISEATEAELNDNDPFLIL